MGLLKKILNWLGHVERVAEDNIVQKIKRWKPMSKRPIGRPKTHWEEDDVLEDTKSINIRNWKKVAQNRDSWKKVLSKPEPYADCSAEEEEELTGVTKTALL